jgi:hypothetical protein
MENKCRRCGRALKTPEAVKEGIGAVCARKEVYEMTHEMHPDAPIPKKPRQSKRAKLVRFAFDLGVQR